MKKPVSSALIAFCLVSVVILATPMSARADVDVATARITMIGMLNPNETRGAMVMLQDMSTAPRWSGDRQFFLSQAILGNQGLATLLTAFSMGKTVWVRIAGTGEPLSLITVIYVNAD